MFSKKGFTLIEIMIVLAIMGAVMVVAIPRLVRQDGNAKSVVRKILVMTKEVRTKARLGNVTYRIAIRMESNNSAYWVERGNGPMPVDPEAYEKERERQGRKQDDDAPPPPFQIDKSVTRKEVPLPGNLRFASLETANMKTPITEGMAYIHFFPEGFVEAAALQITDGNKLTWTLVFNPLTGQADIIEKAQSLKDLQR